MANGSGNSDRFYFLGLQNHCGQCLKPWNSKMLDPWKESYDKPRQCIKKQRHYFTNKGPYSQSYDFSSSHVRMWELDHNVGWALKNWCFQIVVLEKTLESPLDSKEINPVNSKENHLEYSLEGLKLKLEGLIFWPPDVKSWLNGKDPDAGKDWGQVEKGMPKEGLLGWHLIEWTWVKANLGRSWRTGKPGQSAQNLIGHQSWLLSLQVWEINFYRL